jgi:hypothetical protein
MTTVPNRDASPVGYMTDAEIAAFEAAHNKSPWLAGLLNLVPGIGYIYAKRRKLGVAAVLILPVAYFMSRGLFIWWWALLLADAYYCARLYNCRIFEEEWRRHEERQIG